MDLATLIADKPLLANLSREYELLKVTNASVDYEEWITRRLQLAAAARQSSTQQQAAQAVAAGTHAPSISGASLQGPGIAPSTMQPHISGAPSDGQAVSMAGGSAGHLGQQEAAQVQYWRQENKVQGQQHNSASQPQWVAAARLQTSLQSSGMVPVMHAAADRDRKLAATSALVREQLALGEAGVSNVATWRQLFLRQQNQALQQQHQQNQGLQHQQQQGQGFQQQHQQDQGLRQQHQQDQGDQQQHQQDQGDQQQHQQDQGVQQQHQQDQGDQQQHQQHQSLQQQQQQDQGHLVQQQHYVMAQPANAAAVAAAAAAAGSEGAAARGPQQWPGQQQKHKAWPAQQQPQQQTPPLSQGSKSQSGVNTAATLAAVTSLRESHQQQQQEQQQTRQHDQQQQQQTPLSEAVKESWLLKSVLQPNNGKAMAKQVVSGKAPAPDFLRITGEAGSKPIRQQLQPPQQQQQQQGPKAADRRSQLKAAFKQLISSNAGARVEQRPDQVISVLQSLLGVKQQQQLLGMFNVQQRQQGMLDGQQQQQHFQQVAVLLQKLLQGIGSKDNKQDERRQGLRQQDENAVPWDDNLQQEHSPSHFHAKQQLLHRQQQRQQHKLQKAAAAAGSKSPQRHKQQQRQRAKPAWQSEVYVPPPVQLLKRKNGGFADVWGRPIERKLPPVRPSSASKLGRRRPLSAKSLGRPTNKPAHRQQPQQPSDQHADLDSGYAAAGGTLGLAHEGAQEQQLFVEDLLVAATKLSNPSSGGHLHGLPSRAAVHSPPTAAAVQGVRQSTAGAFVGLNAGQVQAIEQQVQQQLQQQQQEEEAARLSRLEQTASHILGVVARLEQQLQQPQVAAPAFAAASTAADTGSPAAPPASVPAAPALPAAPVHPAAAAAAACTTQLQDPAVLCDLLRTLEQLEAQEQEICNRWFSSSEVSAVPVGQQPAQATRTVAVLQAADDVSEPPPQQQTTLHQAAMTQATDTADNSSILKSTLCKNRSTEPQQLQQLGPLSKDIIRSIKSGRRRFLKHQALVDGNLEVLDVDSPSPTFGITAESAARAVEQQASRKTKGGKQQLQPTLVVEAVADLLLDELMMCQVKELEGFMDALCNQLFDDEFQDA